MDLDLSDQDGLEHLHDVLDDDEEVAKFLYQWARFVDSRSDLL